MSAGNVKLIELLFSQGKKRSKEELIHWMCSQYCKGYAFMYEPEESQKRRKEAREAIIEYVNGRLP